MTNNNNRSADDVIVYYLCKNYYEINGKKHQHRGTFPINLSELAEKATRNYGAKTNSIDYYDGFVDGIDLFLSKIREAMR